MSWDEPQPRKKRKWIGMTIVLAIFLGLVAATVVIGEHLARDFAGGLVADQVGSVLGAEDNDQVTVEFGGGPVLAQAVGGSFDEVIISVDDAVLGTMTADLVLVANGVPLDLQGGVPTMSATVSFSPASMLLLAPSLTDAPITAVEAIGSDLVFSSTTDAGGVAVPVTVLLTPSAVDGYVVFAATGLTANGEPLDVAQAQAGAYGPIAALLSSPRSLCLAPYLPAPFVLTSAEVSGGELVVTFVAKDISLADGGLGTKGECVAPA